MTAAKKQPARPAAKKPATPATDSAITVDNPTGYTPPAGTRLDPLTNELVADD
jgi:hypothetical protein